MLTPSFRNTLFTAVAIVALASLAFAGPVNCAATPSDPACAPTLLLSYHPSGGGPVTFAPGGTPTFSNGSWLVDFTPQTFPAFLFTGGQEVSAPDPFVGFSFGVINNSAHNLTFNYDFVTPFAGGPYTTARTIFVDILLNTASAGTASVSPTGDPFIMESFVNGVMIPGFGRGTGCTAAGPSFFCQSGAVGPAGPISYVTTASGTLEVKGAFILTPGSQYTLTGRTEIIPEPGSLVLFGSGILGLAGVIRRKLML